MSTCMVRLQPGQRRGAPVHHPLLKDLPKPLPKEQVEVLLARILEGDIEARNELILAHLPMLSHTVGRYLYNWPLTRRFLDEMVSAGVLGMTKAAADITEEALAEKTVGVIILGYIRKYIEEEVARLRGIVPASVRTNQRRVAAGLEPIFGETVGDLTSQGVEDSHYYMEEGFEIFDVLEAVNQLKGEFSRIDAIFDKKYWGLSDDELAVITGVKRRMVCWYRSELLQRYRELTDN